MRSNREARLQRQAEVDDDFDKLLAIATGGNNNISTVSSTVQLKHQHRKTPSYLQLQSGKTHSKSKANHQHKGQDGDNDSKAVPHYGGSLPLFYLQNKSPSPVYDESGMFEDYNDSSYSDNTLLLAMTEGEKVRLSIPASPVIQRSHSDGDCSPMCYSGGATTPTKQSSGKNSPSKFFNNVKSLLESCDKRISCISPPLSPPTGNSSLDLPKCCTAPHSRSSSFKRKRVKDMMKKDAELNERTSSMPSINKKCSEQSNSKQRPNNLGLSPLHLLPRNSSEFDDWERVRNFMTSPKTGIVNCGDSFRRSTSSLRSMGSWGSGSHGSEDNYGPFLGLPQTSIGNSGSFDGGAAVPLHRVVILGGPGVGKTTLAQQFVTSECLVNVESVGEFEDCITVSVLLNDEEARVDILEIPYNHDYKHISNVDAYIIVYASTDRSSFHHAVDLLYELCKQDSVQRPVILVANKSDLVRAREIAEQEGKSAAVTYNCKYFEVSSLMNLQADELLAGILNQIRLHALEPPRGSSGGCGTGGTGHHHQGWGSNKKLFHSSSSSSGNHQHHKYYLQPFPLVDKIFNRPRSKLRRQGSKSCDNLLVI